MLGLVILYLKWSESHSVVSDSLQPHGCTVWNSPDQNTGVGSPSLLQEIFPTQGLNPGLPCCGQILYQLSHKGSPRILEWVAYPFSSGSSRLGNLTRVSCIAGRFFTNWAVREALCIHYYHPKSSYCYLSFGLLQDFLFFLHSLFWQSLLHITTKMMLLKNTNLIISVLFVKLKASHFS